MEKELIINATPTAVEIALLENNKLVEIHSQKTNVSFSVGDIFLGTVRRLMPGLNAAFVDIGHRKDAFLHYTDLGPKLKSLVKYTSQSISGKMNTHLLDQFQYEEEIVKTGKINQVLTKNQNVLVQVLKEPISTKGPRLSCEVTIPGRHLVLTPFSDVVAVSKKIRNAEERKRLKVLVESIKPKNFGLIVRTAAEGKKVADLHEELSEMVMRWEQIHRQLRGAKPPLKLLSELDKASSILRDVLSDSFNRIVVDDKELHANIKALLQQMAPDQVNILKLHKSNKPIFDEFGVTRQIKASFGKTATMPSGAYLVIEHTEAMHVVDVNSGNKLATANLADTAFKVNLEAAEEIARQVRLRDIGGIIIIDFIDMRNAEHRKELYNAMKEFMRKDRAQHTILQLSKFGLMQITRQRVRPEVKINTAERCPTCNGTGKITASILVTDRIEKDLEFVVQARPKSKISLRTHPFVASYLTKGWKSARVKWFMKHFKWIKLVPDNDYPLTEYHFFDDHEDEIRL